MATAGTFGGDGRVAPEFATDPEQYVAAAAALLPVTTPSQVPAAR